MSIKSNYGQNKKMKVIVIPDNVTTLQQYIYFCNVTELQDVPPFGLFPLLKNVRS